MYFQVASAPAIRASAEETLNMLSPAHQPAPGSTASPGLYTSPSPTLGASTAGFSVTVMPAISAFFSSLSPGYVPEGGQRQLLASTSANDGNTSVGEAGKDDENNVLDKVKLACTIASCLVPTARVVSEAVATVCSSFALAQTLGSVLERKDSEQQSGEKQTSAFRPGSNGAAATAVLTLVALDNMAPAAAVPPRGERGSPEQPIEVPDSETLGKIGQADYPADAYYVQTADLDGFRFNGNKSLVFNGHYDGRNHKIEGLQTCLFNHLQGTVKNLHLTRATIRADGQPAAVVACTMSDAGAIEYVRLSDCLIHNRGSAPTGAISGERVGEFNRVVNGVVLNSMLKTEGPDAPAGMVAGKCQGNTTGVEIINSQVVTHGNGSHAGLGCGVMSNLMDQFVSSCSRAKTHGDNALAGIGAGVINNGSLGPMSSLESSTSTGGIRAPAGIGAGSARLSSLQNITAVNSMVTTKGTNSSAGVTAGFLDEFSLALNIAAVDCQVVTAGDGAVAAVCTGEKAPRTFEEGCTSVSSSAQAKGNYSRAELTDRGQGETSGIKALNTRINDRPYNTGDVNNRDTLCSSADPDFIQPDCQTALQPCPIFPVADSGLSTLIVAGIIAGGATLVLITAGCCCYCLCRNLGRKSARKS